MMDVLREGACLTVPFFVFIAGLISIDSPGPVLYRQARVGKKGKRYTMYKFRTMHVNADEVLESCLEKDDDLTAEWEKFQKLKDDPRITRIGRFLRRFSIDELAQLWNVLKGEMSLVGPRPILLNQERQYGENFEHYIRVAPGISGLWQIPGETEHLQPAGRAGYGIRDELVGVAGYLHHGAHGMGGAEAGGGVLRKKERLAVSY
jgi:lipopolysaccharide/colanic/teichoic acid biosynthesis glycosyltransferase